MKSFTCLLPSRWPGWLALMLAAALPLHAQRLTVTDRQAAPVVVESAAIHTEVAGRIAVTTFDLVFRNPNDRLLEGTFEFPLLDGQQVTGFSLDINGKQRAAVPVEKDKGRIVFEQIERRRVDPGLLEQTAGNNYRARIYPIPARGTRRVTITYQENLGAGSEEATYRLPLDFRAPLQRFDLTVEVPAGAEAIKTHTTLPLELPAWEQARVFRLHRTDFPARGLVELRLPPLTQPQVITERRREVEYFHAEVPVTGLVSEPRPNPGVVGVLWDASGSGDGRDHAREFEVLDAWFAAVRDVEVHLVVLRDQAAAPLRFTVKKGDWSALRRELKNTVYDGATSFDGLADDPAVGEWLLFSDGLVNYGTHPAGEALPLRAPVHVVLAATRADPAFLRGLARRHAGEFVNLLDTGPRAAARLLRQESVRVLAIETQPAEVAQVFPETGAVVREGRVTVTGILQAPATTLRLRIGTPQAAREVEVTVASGENPGEMAARSWAVNKIASLEPDFAANREDIRQTSREFGIVTPDTSLIVLETLNDYVTYDIAPPDEWRKEWASLRRTASESRKRTFDQRREVLAAQFAERIHWWETKIPGQYPIPNGSNPAPRPAGAPRPPESPTPWTVTVNTPAEDHMEDDVLILSPFVVNDPGEMGYMATSTLAGTRTGTMLHDVSSSRVVSGNRTAAAAENEEEEDAPVVEPGDVHLQPWNAKSGIIDRLRRAAPARRYAVYLENRVGHRREPGFFLATANFFFSAGDEALGRRILSNLAELGLDHPPLLRALAHRLMDAGRADLAQPLFARVLVLRPEEPQSRRDLALAWAILGQPQRAVDLLWSIVTDADTSRFAEIEMTALGEMNAIIARAPGKLDLSGIDGRFLRNLPVGLRVVLSWDSDACDIDLWVDDPDGERAIYDHPNTRQGGRLSRDYTQGYGPEEFLLRDPKPGKYTVRIDYFGEQSVTQLGPVTAQIRFVLGFGTPGEQEKRQTVVLERKKDHQLVGTIEIPAAPAEPAKQAAMEDIVELTTGCFLTMD